MANQQATVTFTAPSDNGGSVILDYTAKSYFDGNSVTAGVTATGNASPITVTGLTNSIAYKFTVSARNIVGAGAESGFTNSVTPSNPVSSTFSPLEKNAALILSNNNLSAAAPNSAGLRTVKTTTSYQSTGKYYCEFTINSPSGGSNMIGIANSSAALTNYLGFDVNGYSYYITAGQKVHNGVGSVPPGASGAGAGAIISMLFDADTGTLEFWKNGISFGQYYTGITGSWKPAVYFGNDNGLITVNFGASAFAYTIPSGYTTWPTVPAVSATLNPADKSAHWTLSNGNLTATSDGFAGQMCARSNQYYSASGKYYCEYHIDSDNLGIMVGLLNSSAALTNYIGFDANGYGYKDSNGGMYHSSVLGGTNSGFITGDIISMLFDAGAGTLTFWRNGSVQASIFTGISTSIAWTPAIRDFGNGIGVPPYAAITINYGATAWSYTPPAGYIGWAT